VWVRISRSSSSLNGPGFLQHPVGDPDLADVVKQEAVLGAGILRQVGAQRLRERDGVALDALGMSACAGVLRLERARERGDGLFVGLLEQDSLPPFNLEQMAKIAGVELQLLLDPHRLARPERKRVHPAGEALDDGEQFQRAERLLDERVAAGGLALDLRLPVRPGQEDDGDALRSGVALDPPAELDPVHAGHADVEDDDVGRRPFERAGSGGGVIGLLQLDVDGLEGRAEKRTKPRVVIDKENAHVSKVACGANFLCRPTRPNSLEVSIRKEN
jgi:hypothetical protein